MALKHVSHLKSNVVQNGNPKLPTASQMLYGEIAVNYADGKERLSIKNDNNDIVTFVPGYELDSIKSDMLDNARVTAAALTDLNSRIGSSSTELDEIRSYMNEMAEVTSSALTDLNTKTDELDANVTEVNAGLQSQINQVNTTVQSQITQLSGQLTAMNEYVEEIEYVIAQAITDLNSRVTELSNAVSTLQSIVNSL